MIINKLNRPQTQTRSDYDLQLWDELERFSFDVALLAKLLQDSKVSSQPSVSAGTGVRFTSNYIRCESDGGAVNITANPQIGAGKIDGELLIIEGTSDTNTLEFENGDGLSMGANFILSLNDIIAFTWNKNSSEWIMNYSDTK